MLSANCYQPSSEKIRENTSSGPVFPSYISFVLELPPTRFKTRDLAVSYVGKIFPTGV